MSQPEQGIVLNIDGREVEVAPGTSIWDAARAEGIDVPALCHDPRTSRSCMPDPTSP